MEKEEDKYMDKYARSLAGQGQKISPEDSDYKEKLIHVVQSFRTFDVALDDFILHHGYTGELSDIDGKIRFIKAKFKLGSKDLTSLTSGYWMLRYNKIPKKGKVKVQIQTTKNYKIDSITVTYRNGDKYTSKKIKNGAKVSLKNAMSLNVDYHTTVKPKYYRKPSSDYVGYFFGGYVESPLYESFSLVMM